LPYLQIIMAQQEEIYRIIGRCQKGDRHAQFKLYESFYGWSLAICRRYCRSEETAEECVQDGFFKVFAKIYQYKSNLPFQPWLKTVMIRTCIDHQRSTLKELFTVELEPVHDESGVPEALVNVEVEHLLLMMRQLPPVYQTTLTLYAIEGYEYQEIANMLGVNIGSVKSNLSKARGKLKALLTNLKEQEAHAG